ncbi:MAG: glycosyltransferase family 4 protein [Candidatus Niyogibacteria bacterium]|nr:glycosyltransferase family 4 protein [Candidatus Niyogibacteria bacterium]
MKIVFITSKLNFTGAGGSVEEIDIIARTLMKLGNEVVVITAFSHFNDINQILPYKVVEERISSGRMLGIQRGVFELLKKYEDQADFFHVDHLFLYGAGFYRRIGGKIPIVLLFNQFMTCLPDIAPTLFPRKKSFFVRLKQKIRFYVEKYIGVPIANGIDIFAIVSPPLKKMYEDFGIRGRLCNIVLGDPTDFRQIMTEGGTEKDSYIKRNKRQGSFIIFYSSRMVSGKGFDLLLDGFSKVKNKDNFRLILGGSGPEEKIIHKMAFDLNLEKYVTFPGWVSRKQLFSYYKNADIFIQVGWRPEGTSISLQYAMAFGIPSILPGGGGLEWVAKDSAIYVKNGDPYDLAEKIEKLAGDYDLRATLSRNCYRRISDDEMNYEMNIRRLFEKMKELVNLKTP